MNDKKQIFVYVGPNRPFNLPLMRNTILSAKPEQVFPTLGKLFEEYKQFKKLFVPVSELAQARDALKKSGSALSLWSGQIKAASETFKTAKG